MQNCGSPEQEWFGEIVFRLMLVGFLPVFLIQKVKPVLFSPCSLIYHNDWLSLTAGLQCIIIYSIVLWIRCHFVVSLAFGICITLEEWLHALRFTFHSYLLASLKIEAKWALLIGKAVIKQFTYNCYLDIRNNIKPFQSSS